MRSPQRRVWCGTLGCDKNLVDSENLLRRFQAAGFAIAEEPDRAEVWVLNTCGFIAAARADSLAAVRALARAKTAGRILAVVGCWAQEHADAIGENCPEVDIVAGVGQFDRVVRACAAGRAARLVVPPAEAEYEGDRNSALLTPRHLAFVKIGEGCSCHCTFCRIPMIRGPLRSRPPADIVGEVERLVTSGVREIQIVSQNTADYGRDRAESLDSLLRSLDAIPDLRRIRLLYLYPGLLSVETMQRVLSLPTVVPYLDAPIQHASPRLLRAMKRPGDMAATLRFFQSLRRERPELVLRTTVMLGFPGEEEEDIEQLADFLATVEFDHLGTYRYSPEIGTPAADLPRRPAAEDVADREARILDLQREISLARQQQRLGGSYEVVIDEVAPAAEIAELWEALQGGFWTEKAERERAEKVFPHLERVGLGRSQHFGYDLDGQVLLAKPDCQPGDWVEARFTGVTEFDCWAVPA